MSIKYKNLIIDGAFPLLFWGSIYFSTVIVGYWSFKQYISWYLVMLFFTPLNMLSGRVINTWRKKMGYEYRGYQ